MRGLHYGQELGSNNRPDTFEQTIQLRQRFCLQAGGGPFIFHTPDGGEITKTGPVTTLTISLVQSIGHAKVFIVNLQTTS